MDRHGHARIDEVEGKVAVRHRIHAVGGEPLESQLPGDHPAHQGQRGTCERGGAERHLVGGLVGVAKPLGIAQQRLGVSKEVMADGDWLGTLKVRVTGHHPRGMDAGFGGKGLGRTRDLGHEGARGGPAVQPQVEGNLVVARAARMERGTGRRDLRQPPLDRGVDVLVGVEERELAFVELASDPAKASLYGRQLALGQKLRRRKAASVRDAAGDVERVEVVIGLKRR